MKKNLLILIAITTSFFVLSSKTNAEEIVVSGNGSGSTNEVNVSSTNNTNVSQSNEANVNNNVSSTSDTGENTASSNTGQDTSITTGDVASNTTVENSLNASSATTNCPCDGDNSSNTTISENGANSNNSLDFSHNNSTNINVSQTANVNNNISGTSNTGHNKASGNLGNVDITTGNITANHTIKNFGINISFIDAASSNGLVSINIISNGTGSTNNVVLGIANAININKVSSANINNNVVWDLNSGNNTANGNLGNVNFKTGDIWENTIIENGPINADFVRVNCGCIPDDPNVPIDPPVSPPTGSSNSTNPTVTIAAAMVLAAAIGPTLPITGNILTFLMTIAAMVMFFLGWYLRLASGNAPPKLAYN